MTSREELNRLLCMAKKGCKVDMCNVKYVENASDIIKKDLEVLNIIKRSITHKEKHTHKLNEKFKGQKYMNISVWINGDNDFNKVKEWLENGN